MKPPRIISELPKARESRQTYTARSRRSEKGLQDRKIKNSFWLDEVVDDRLREMASADRTSKQQLLLEALDLLFSKHGQPSIKELLGRIGDPEEGEK